MAIDWAQVKPKEPGTFEKLMRATGGATLSGLARVGNFLDLPGSMIRDVLALENPLDQLLSPTTADNRITGRDLITKYGLARKNMEGGISDWAKDETEAIRDTGGLAAEIALDPLTYLTFGSSALTKLGREAKKVGKLKGLSEGIAAGQRGLAGVRAPFSDKVLPIGTGAKSVKAAEKIEGAVSELGGTKVGMALQRMFDPRVMDRRTKEGMKAARQVHERTHRAEQGVMSKMLPIGRELERLNAYDSVSAKAQRAYLEGTGPLPDPAVKQHMDVLRKETDYSRKMNEQLGLSSSELDDVTSGYAHRQMSGRAGDDTSGPFSVTSGKDAGREEAWKGFHKGTEGVNELLMDEDLDALIKSGASRKKVKDEIRKKYGPNGTLSAKGHIVEEKYHVRDGGNFQYRVVSPPRELVADPANVTKGTKTVRGKTVDQWELDWDGVPVQVEPVLTKTGIPAITKAGLYKWRRIEDFGGEAALPIGTKTLAQHPSGHYIADVNGKPTLVDPVQANRYDEIADKLMHSPELREEGLFHNHVLADTTEKLVSEAKRREIAHITYDTIAKLARPADRRLSVDDPFGVSAKAVVEKLGLDKDKATQILAQKMGMNPDEFKLSDIALDREIANDLTALWPGMRPPEELGDLAKGVQSLTNLFKVGVLTWPARFMRDLVSAQARNLEAGMFDHLSARQFNNIWLGRQVDVSDVVQKNQAVQQYMQQNGIQDPAEALKTLYAAMKGGRSDRYADISVNPAAVRSTNNPLGQPVLSKADKEARSAKITGKSFENFMNNTPGRTSQNLRGFGKKLLKTAAGRDKDLTWWNPLKIRGWGDTAETTFGLAKAGEMLGQYTDDMGRGTAWLNLLKKGYDPAEAMKVVHRAQVDYSARNFTTFEKKWLKQLFPFYSFSSRQIPWIVSAVAEQPGGRLAQFIRSTKNVSNTIGVPEYVGQTSSIPLGEKDDGTKSFVTGLGLMHEDPLSFAGSLRESGVEAISRLNPLVKAPLEYFSGESFFQRGPMGGRDLLDMDPAVGRLLANVTGREDPVKLPQLVEHTVMNLPISRAVTTARQLTDRRKTWPSKFFNVMSGLRISDVSPAAQDAIIRESIEAAMREGGAQMFERVHFTKAQKAKMSPEELKAAELFEAAQNELARRAKARKNAK